MIWRLGGVSTTARRQRARGVAVRGNTAARAWCSKTRVEGAGCSGPALLAFNNFPHFQCPPVSVRPLSDDSQSRKAIESELCLIGAHRRWPTRVQGVHFRARCDEPEMRRTASILRRCYSAAAAAATAQVRCASHPPTPPFTFFFIFLVTTNGKGVWGRALVPAAENLASTRRIRSSSSGRSS